MEEIIKKKLLDANIPVTVYDYNKSRFNNRSTLAVN